MDRCEECGFDYAGVAAGAVPQRLRGFGARFAAALAAVPEARRRPAPDVWSPLEYTCHVRDVFVVQRERLMLGLREDRPEFAPMGREERVVADAYNDQDPSLVLAALSVAASALAASFEVLSTAELARTGRYPWPEPAERTLLWLGRHTVHEGEHHLLDVTRF
ncbi:DinB family protein [Dactylosporangium sp. AC04546]|uniref:DinB family protein n=1 Tax=Dactylosporangium sp. AC04546 TaxID=2862460 RepID=UPI001EDD261A|nr:DinB family protein [Dactylosporangium sp. AC04546]WVK80115.1 DinB family protein [Dactylosporangium sp. AC04546]